MFRRVPATPRLKACNACADSKRRCDKQFPECQRCLDRDVDCVYPQPKRKRRDLARGGQAERALMVQNHANCDALEGSLDIGGWRSMVPIDLDIPLSDIIDPDISTLVAQGEVPEVGNRSSQSSLWFLQDETWIMQQGNEHPACVADLDLEPFIRIVEEMLQFWVRDGYNSFIHRRLYAKGMPTCLQDAFTTLAAYTSSTKAVKETILQIAEERSSALVCQSAPTATGVEGIMAHLARVHALFVYEFIRLFDGSVRLRASAEKQLPTLRQWVIQMWEAVRRHCWEDCFRGRHSVRWVASEFDRECDDSLETWRLWILTESIRRTHLVVDTVANMYKTMTEGWAECAGAVMLTARRGLWEADSAAKWLELSSAQVPLLVPSLQPGPVISQYAAEEFDDFVKLLWTFVVGKDKIQCWIDRSHTTIGV